MSRILIIEDDRTINGLLRSVLEKSGYTVDSADNGAEGLALGRQGSYSLILLDLMLPEKPGEEIIKELRRADMTPVIILSAKGRAGGGAGPAETHRQHHRGTGIIPGFFGMAESGTAANPGGKSGQVGM